MLDISIYAIPPKTRGQIHRQHQAFQLPAAPALEQFGGHQRQDAPWKAAWEAGKPQ